MDEIKIGSLRWMVWLANRQSLTTPTGAMAAILIQPIQVYADIQPSAKYNLIYGKNEDAQNPITHTAIIRFQNNLDMFDVILRDTINPDGTITKDRFHVIGFKTVDGRKRFLELDLSLEESETETAQ